MKIRTFALGGLMAAAAMVLALFAAPAAAQDYPPTGPSVTCPASVAPGGDLTCQMENFAPGEGSASYNPTFPVTIGADGTGSFTHTVAADQAPGEYTLTVTVGATTGTTTFTVAAAQDGGDLPRTGTDGSLPMAQTAVAAIAAGGLMVLVANRRRSKAAA